MLCFLKFTVKKKFMDKRGGRRIKIFSWKSFVSKCGKTSQGTFLCCVSEFFGSEKYYGYERVDIKIFRTVFLFSQCGKSHFKRESLSVPLFLGIEKVCG